MESENIPIVIGRTDKADFPDLHLKRLRVKIDTGAYTSSIHCCEISETDENKLKVIFLDDEDPKYTGKIHYFENYKKKSVKSSNGRAEERFIITTKISFHHHIYDIELSVTYRGDMRFPVLIGRKFLIKQDFIVNPKLANHIHKTSLSKKNEKRD